MGNSGKIRIFVSYKNKNPLVSNEIIFPIQTGCAIADEMFEGMLRDNTGDNISKENDRYNELTAQYWVWKHYEAVGNPEYVGFMHYRRHFIFDQDLKHLPLTWLPDSEFYYVPEMYAGYMTHFTPEKVLPYLEKAPDCIAYKKYNVRSLSDNCVDMSSHFAHYLVEMDKRFLEVMEAVIERSFPQYYETCREFVNGSHLYVCNSFIMKKSLFFEYSAFLFKVLGEVDRLIDHTGFSKARLRFLGFMGEYLQTIFLMQKKKIAGITITELPMAFIAKPSGKLKRKLLKYRILSRLSFGKRRKYYQRKLNKLGRF